MREHGTSTPPAALRRFKRPMVEDRECAPTGSHQDFGSAKKPVGQIDAEVEAVELERFADTEAESQIVDEAKAENHPRREETCSKATSVGDERELDPLDFEGQVKKNIS